MDQTTIADDVSESLASLHTRLVDARDGFDEAVRLAASADLGVLFQALRDLHARHADALAATLVARGAQPDADGSFMGLVHKAMLNVRAGFAGLDEAALPAILDGEERLRDAYDEAVEGVCEDAAASALVLEQIAELEAQLASLEARANWS